MPVTPLRMTARLALKIIREAARDSSNVFISPDQDAGAWRSVVTYRQVYRCLEDGDLIKEPELDVHGNYVCILRRTAAGVEVVVTVVAMKKDDHWQLLVQKVNT